MPRPIPALACALGLVALSTCGPTAPTDGETATIDAELAAALALLDTPEARRSCSAEELEYEAISLRGFAMGMTIGDPRKMTPSQRTEFDRLMTRWEELGGDTRVISPRCREYIESLV
ncbi:hypothetical protein [Litorisediminicola beolgyonensis]|uniref:Lipoprotein n=1 Tax=Litorisediminicola beolgyonensis TaxID=1173614 RepID=A0ABW3ZLA0_9RHOB